MTAHEAELSGVFLVGATSPVSNWKTVKFGNNAMALSGKQVLKTLKS